MSSKDVLGVLQAAGLDVKAAASSVDDADVERAFSAGKADGDGAAPAKGGKGGKGGKASNGKGGKGGKGGKAKGHGKRTSKAHAPGWVKAGPR